jgi:hypothetical protein
MSIVNVNATTTPDELKEILETDLSDAILNAFINAAYTFRIEYLASAGLSAAALAEIEKWLAAHFAAVSRQRQEESENIAGEYSVKYTGKTDMFLSSTLYGQMALSFDPSGTLASVGLKGVEFDVYVTSDHSTAVNT